MKKILFLSLIISPIIHSARLWLPPLSFINDFKYTVPEHKKLIQPWAIAYGRTANSAFNKSGHASHAAITQLLFNQANFTAAQAFANSTVNSSNIWLTTSILSPRVHYKEHGASFGCNSTWKINDCWSAGFSLELPVKKVSLNRSCNGCSQGSSDLGGSTLSDVAQTKKITSGENTYTSYAYRLDFLSQLPDSCTELGRQYPLIEYHDPMFLPAMPITISNVDVTEINDNPIGLLVSSDGSVPPEPWSVQQSTNLSILPADGITPPNQTKERFVSTIDYTPLKSLPDAQKRLWVVPALVPDNNGNLTTAVPARVIRAQVENLMSCIGNSAEDIFAPCAICFASQKRHGCGDLISEFYATYHTPQSNGQFTLLADIVWPTSKTVTNPRRVFEQPLGNNGHFELHIGCYGVYEISRFAFAGYATYLHTFNACEKATASFVGASVKNIGPTIPIQISWDAFIGGLRADVVLIPRHALSLNARYELYTKSANHLNCAPSSAYDCLGIRQPIEKQFLTCATAQQAHTIQFELNGSYKTCTPLIGVRHIFAGKQVLQLTDWYAGLSFNF